MKEELTRGKKDLERARVRWPQRSKDLYGRSVYQDTTCIMLQHHVRQSPAIPASFVYQVFFGSS